MVELCNNGSEFALHIHKIIIITIFLILSWHIDIKKGGLYKRLESKFLDWYR